MSLQREIVSKPTPGDPIGETGNNDTVFPSQDVQDYFDELQQRFNDLLHIAIMPPQYTVATVPTAANYVGGIVHITDEAGGPVNAESDGTNWRRTSDGAVIS